jgi:hypothetical protein
MRKKEFQILATNIQETAKFQAPMAPSQTNQSAMLAGSFIKLGHLEYWNLDFLWLLAVGILDVPTPHIYAVVRRCVPSLP